MNQKNEVWPNGMPEVGQMAQRSREVAARDIELFTEISGDRNPLHYDEEAARATRFGGIVVQGGVTSAILNAVVAEDLPGPGTVFLQVNWSFKRQSNQAIPSRVKSGSLKSGQTNQLLNWIPALFSLTGRLSLKVMQSATPCRFPGQRRVNRRCNCDPASACAKWS